MTRILLVGMMGSGKTTVGSLLAERLGCPYSDSDADVVATAGRSVAEIFADEGEAAFRALESRVLTDVLAGTPGPLVVSVAGGAVLDPSNRALLREAGTVVWLRAEVATLARRVGDGTGRPLLSRDAGTSVPPVATTLASLDAVRRPLYEEVSEVVVDVDDATPDDVVGTILDVIGRAA